MSQQSKKILHSIREGLHFPSAPNLQIQRMNYTYIMNHISEHTKTADMELFNNFRLFIKALTLPDIVTPDGSLLDKNALCGRRSISYRFKSI